MTVTDLYHPAHDRILVEYVDAPQPSKSTLYVPSDDSRTAHATVLAVGPGRMTEQGVVKVPPVRVGDTVLVLRGQGDPLKFGGKEYMFIHTDGLISTVTP